MRTLALTLIFATAAVFAQSNATDSALEGYVVDATQAFVSGAKITARNIRTNVASNTVTSDAGYYRFPLLPVGEYEVTVLATGFREYRQSGISLAVGRQVRVDAALQVGSAADSITVTADASIVETGQTASGEVINSRSVRNLPIVSRNVYNFNLLGPGVKGIPSTGFGTTQFTFGGTSRASWNTDGLDNSQRRTNRQIRLVINTPEAIEESQVLSNGYSAEFGRAAGGQINIITRSGTNEFHGSGMFLYRFRDLQARPSLAARNPERTWKDAAFTLGGPILKNRLFFFAQYEYNPYTLPTAISISNANASALGLPASELGNSPFGEDFRTSMMKVSYQLNDKNSGFFRYSRFTNEQPNGAGGLTVPSRGVNFLDRMNGGAFQLATTISPTTLNEFRFGINRRHELRDAVGLPSSGNPAVDIASVANIGVNPLAGVENIEQSTQFIDNFTKTTGKHTLKAGTDIQLTDYKLNSSLDRRFTFQGVAAVAGVRGAVSPLDQYLNTVRSVIDPATGRPFTYTQLSLQTGDRFLALNYKFLNFFALDEFRITPRFTLN
ncbi:MAG: TonB-dependent receptor, partial [Bryobacteraceae bacterium]|nr:TonB-dependent receptor [Bryobacteraceae bacterium]